MNNPCGEIKYLMAAAVDGEITDIERKRLDAHVDNCETCAADYELVASTQDDLKLLAGVSAPDHLLARLQNSAGKKQKPGRSFALGGPPSRRGWMFTGVGLAAAAVLVVAVVFTSDTMKNARRGMLESDRPSANAARKRLPPAGTSAGSDADVDYLRLRNSRPDRMPTNEPAKRAWANVKKREKPHQSAFMPRDVLKSDKEVQFEEQKQPRRMMDRALGEIAEAPKALPAPSSDSSWLSTAGAFTREKLLKKKEPAPNRPMPIVGEATPTPPMKVQHAQIMDPKAPEPAKPGNQHIMVGGRKIPIAAPRKNQVGGAKGPNTPLPPARKPVKPSTTLPKPALTTEAKKLRTMPGPKPEQKLYEAATARISADPKPEEKRHKVQAKPDPAGAKISDIPLGGVGVTGRAISADKHGVTIEKTDGRRERMGWKDIPQDTRRRLGKEFGVEVPVMPEPQSMFFNQDVRTNPWVDPDHDPKSTVAMDVDTGSYTIVRNYLKGGRLPPFAAVRPEEFINYFDYLYDAPERGTFGIELEAAPTPFSRTVHGDTIHTLRVGIQAKRVDKTERKDAILVFVVDTSGSMRQDNRLGLVKSALGFLVDELGPGDKVGIVEYGTEARTVLKPVGAQFKHLIRTRVNRLVASGSTNAEAGLVAGYKMAMNAQREGAVNRVILLSDGVANVGRTGPDAILRQIKKFVDEGVTLTTVGVGMGNYNDKLLERLADTGNGNYAYVDDVEEAKRVFSDQLTGTLQTVAKDAKVQVEFNPMTVRYYRLIGYENRGIADKDFRNNAVDAGEVGAGHSVTALYELRVTRGATGKVATVRVRHEDPDTTKVTEVQQSIEMTDLARSFVAAPASFRLATCVAEFAEILRGASEDGNLTHVESHVRGVVEEYDGEKNVNELIDMVRRAREAAKRRYRR